jgi:hypothetical protein
LNQSGSTTLVFSFVWMLINWFNLIVNDLIGPLKNVAYRKTQTFDARLLCKLYARKIHNFFLLPITPNNYNSSESQSEIKKLFGDDSIYNSCTEEAYHAVTAAICQWSHNHCANCHKWQVCGPFSAALAVCAMAVRPLAYRSHHSTICQWITGRSWVVAKSAGLYGLQHWDRRFLNGKRVCDPQFRPNLPHHGLISKHLVTLPFKICNGYSPTWVVWVEWGGVRISCWVSFRSAAPSPHPTWPPPGIDRSTLYRHLAPHLHRGSADYYTQTHVCCTYQTP